MKQMVELELFKNKVKFFDCYEKHRFNEKSRLLIAVPGLDLKIKTNDEFSPEKEIKEAEMFAKHVGQTIGAQVLVLVELDKIDDILDNKPIDCLIDLHELHSRQRDFIMEKITKPDETQRSKYIALYP